MPRTGERSNYFIRRGAIVMVSPGKEDKIVSSVSGNFVGIDEMVTRKLKGRSTHWIVVEMDKDNLGPTKGVYLDAENYNAVSGVVALFRLGRGLQERDVLTFKVGRNNSVKIDLNGMPVIPDEGGMKVFREQDNSFEAMLDAVRGEHKEVDFRDQVEDDCFYKVLELVREHIYCFDKEDIRPLVLSKFLPDLKPDCSFEEIYPLLRHKFSDKVI